MPLQSMPFLFTPSRLRAVYNGRLGDSLKNSAVKSLCPRRPELLLSGKGSVVI